MPTEVEAVFASKTADAPEAFKQEYLARLEECRRSARGFEVVEAFRYDDGNHPDSYVDAECRFAADCLARGFRERSGQASPEILDVGSYRHFILGLLAHHRVTTVDVRKRLPATDNETTVTCDAKRLSLPDGAFDAVVSLCAVEHFGLGRYGDAFDLDGDRKAFEEMKRVLRPGGALIFTTTLTRTKPHLAFNAHRIYDRPMIEALCAGLRMKEERFYLMKKKDFGPWQDVTRSPGAWDVYCGWWVKPASART